jgi:RNA polymerase sigma-32 factor
MNAKEVQAVAKDLGVPVADVLEMESRLSGHDTAFDAPADNDDDARPAPVAYLVDNAADPYHTLESEDQEESDLDSLKRGLARLDSRSRDIIQRRWLRDEDKSTLQELADEYGVSAERIRQIEVNAMKKMRTLFAA